MKFQLRYILLVKPAVNYSQIPAKGREILKRWKRKASPETQYLTGSRALGKRLGLVNDPLRDKEHMAFTLKEKFFKKHLREGNIEPQAATFGEGQKEGSAVS